MLLDVVIPECSLGVAARQGRLEVFGELVAVRLKRAPIVGGMGVKQQPQA